MRWCGDQAWLGNGLTGAARREEVLEMIPGFQASATGRTFVGGGTVSWEYEMIDMVGMIDMDIFVVGS